MSEQQQPSQQLTIKQRLSQPSMIAELGKAMPAHCKPERMARIAMTALTRTPKLAECDQASFFRCLLDLSQWGLEPDGRRAHLIPFENKKRGVVECQLIIDYKGYVELAYRSGVVRNIHADIVREGDLFTYSKGKVVEHVPWFLRRDADKPEKPGNIFAVYCTVELIGGTEKCEVLSVDEVNAIRARSRAGNSGPWATDWAEMSKKTAFRRVSKWIPVSADFRDALERDDDRFDDLTHTSSGHHPKTVDDLGKLIASAAPAPQQEQPQQSDDSPTMRPENAAEAKFAELNDAIDNIGDPTDLETVQDDIHAHATLLGKHTVTLMKKLEAVRGQLAAT